MGKYWAHLCVLLFISTEAFSAQHDYNIANDTGANVRADINSVLTAIATLNSGTSAPTTTFAYQLWVDTTTGLLKIRNAANTDWVIIGDPTVASLGLLSKAGGTMTGPVLLSNGASDSTPDLSFSGDANTGIFSPGADIFGIAAGGTEFFRFTSSTGVSLFSGTGAVQLPSGTTAQQPVTPANGMIRYNTDENSFEGYADGEWGSIGGGKRLSSTFTGTSISPTSNIFDETFLYTGSSAETFTGFGTISSLEDGYRVTIIGSSDTDTLTIEENDDSNGWLMNGDIELGRGKYIIFEYNSTLGRMIEVGRSQDA